MISFGWRKINNNWLWNGQKLEKRELLTLVNPNYSGEFKSCARHRAQGASKLLDISKYNLLPSGKTTTSGLVSCRAHDKGQKLFKSQTDFVPASAVPPAAKRLLHPDSIVLFRLSVWNMYRLPITFDSRSKDKSDSFDEIRFFFFLKKENGDDFTRVSRKRSQTKYTFASFVWLSAIL